MELKLQYSLVVYKSMHIRMTIIVPCCVRRHRKRIVHIYTARTLRPWRQKKWRWRLYYSLTKISDPHLQAQSNWILSFNLIEPGGVDLLFFKAFKSLVKWIYRTAVYQWVSMSSPLCQLLYMFMMTNVSNMLSAAFKLPSCPNDCAMQNGVVYFGPTLNIIASANISIVHWAGYHSCRHAL